MCKRSLSVLLDFAEAGNALDANDVRGISDPPLQFHEQISAAGEDYCFSAIPVQEADSILHAFRFVVGKSPHFDNLLVICFPGHFSFGEADFAGARIYFPE